MLGATLLVRAAAIPAAFAKMRPASAHVRRLPSWPARLPRVPGPVPARKSPPAAGRRPERPGLQRPAPSGQPLPANAGARAPDFLGRWLQSPQQFRWPVQKGHSTGPTRRAGNSGPAHSSLVGLPSPTGKAVLLPRDRPPPTDARLLRNFPGRPTPPAAAASPAAEEAAVLPDTTRHALAGTRRAGAPAQQAAPRPVASAPGLAVARPAFPETAPASDRW